MKQIPFSEFLDKLLHGVAIVVDSTELVYPAQDEDENSFYITGTVINGTERFSEEKNPTVSIDKDGIATVVSERNENFKIQLLVHQSF